MKSDLNLNPRIFVTFQFAKEINSILWSNDLNGKKPAPVSCSSTSHQCCWVIRSWQLLGKTTTVSKKSPIGCCAMAGVKCSGSSVTDINWDSQGLNGEIPNSLKKLIDLKTLYVNEIYSQIKITEIQFWIKWKYYPPMLGRSVRHLSLLILKISDWNKCDGA